MVKLGWLCLLVGVQIRLLMPFSVFVGRSSGSLQRLVELEACVDIRDMKKNLSAEAKKSLAPEGWSAIRG